MVGHSIGGILTRVYDLRYPGEVAGFVFVESAHPEQYSRTPPEMKARAGGGPPMGLFSLMARIGALRLSARLSAPKREMTPTERGVLAYAPRSMIASMAEYAARDSVAAQGMRAGTLDPRPIIVLTAGLPGQDTPTGIPKEVFAQFRALRMELQEEIAALSSNSDQRLVPESGHVLQMDAPDVTAAAIRDVVAAVQTGKRVDGENGG
jgi:pimeloyl-ACP methyl ester carboxylesterase